MYVPILGAIKSKTRQEQSLKNRPKCSYDLMKSRRRYVVKIVFPNSDMHTCYYAMYKIVMQSDQKHAPQRPETHPKWHQYHPFAPGPPRR